MSSGSTSTAIDDYLSGKYINFTGELLTFVILLMVYIAIQYWWYADRNARIVGRFSNMNSVRRSNQSQPTIFGLHPSVIASMPVMAYRKVRKDLDGDGSVNCMVCLRQLKNRAKVRILPRCKHLFHVKCIDSWLISHSTCPVCRGDAKPPDSLRSPAVVMAGLANARETGSMSGPWAFFRRQWRVRICTRGMRINPLKSFKIWKGSCFGW